MKICGIVAEYNPFHNGHKWQISQMKRETSADFTIIVMSGDFVQRGEPALMEKHHRARLALEHGADLVIELPVRYALGSAEYFASGAVALLDNLGADLISFGSESGLGHLIRKTAALLLDEDGIFADHLQAALAAGASFPAARERAFRESSLARGFSPAHTEAMASLLSSPNDILAVEYTKAILRYGSSLSIHPIRRRGSSYHGQAGDSPYLSASGIRACLRTGATTYLQGQLPLSGLNLLLDKSSEFLFPEDFYLSISHMLIRESRQSLTSYLDMKESTYRRILSAASKASSFQELIQAAAGKDMPTARISRCLFHCLLQLPAFSIPELSRTTAPYARILAFRKDAGPLLSQLKRQSKVPLVSKLADASSLLSPAEMTLLEEDIHASALYEAALACKYHRKPVHEKSRPLVIL